MARSKQSAIISLIVLCLCTTTPGKIIYVDDDANGLNGGSSWQNAYRHLQDALADANAAAKPVEVWVAQGVYRPDQGPGVKPGDHEATFRLVSGVMLRGGYGGATDPDPNAWDPASYETILNGDLKGNDDFTWLATLTDNSSHIVTAIGVDETAVVEGFTIAHGVYLGAFERGGNPGPPQGGAGLYNESGSPRIRECVFTQNYVDLGYGSAVFNSTGSAARFEGCTFRNNDRGPAVVDYRSQSTFHACQFIENRSAGISLTESTSEVSDCLFSRNKASSILLNTKSGVTVLNSTFVANAVAIRDNGGGQVHFEGCTFENNRSEGAGGAAYVDRAGFVDCIFRGNSAIGAGAIWANDLELNRCVLVRNSAQGDGAINCGQARIEHCLFEGNRVDGGTGALFIRKSAVVSNCTFVGSRSKFFGLINAVAAREPVVITNCIFRDNACTDTSSPLIVGNARTALRFSNTSDLANLWRSVGEAVGNVDVDPGFARPGHLDLNETPDDPNDDFWVEGDYHLKSLAGRWDPNEQRWVMDDVSSPCIDAGDPSTPVGEEPQPNGGRINLGAYGGTGEASKSRVPRTFDETLQDLLATIEGQSQEKRMIAKRGPYISIILAPDGTHFAVDPDYRSPVEKAANWFLRQWRDLFVSPSNEVSFEMTRASTTVVRYHQKYAGLEVYGAELLIGLRRDGSIGSVTSNIQTDTSSLDMGEVSVTPSLDAATAQSNAIAFLAAQHALTTLEASSPILMIYAPSLWTQSGPLRLVWLMEVYDLGFRMHEKVLVDAHNGEVALHFSLHVQR